MKKLKNEIIGKPNQIIDLTYRNEYIIIAFGYLFTHY